MTDLLTPSDGGEALVWTRLDEAKSLYENYLKINQASAFASGFQSVSNHVEVREEFPPLTLALCR